MIIFDDVNAVVKYIMSGAWISLLKVEKNKYLIYLFRHQGRGKVNKVKRLLTFLIYSFKEFNEYIRHFDVK